MGRRSRNPAARRSGCRQWTADEARAVLAAWRESGLPLATFARQRGVTAERLRWWRQRLGDRVEAGEAPLGLVPAVVTGLLPASGAAVVTLRAPGDVVVEIADVGAVPAAWLSALVSGLARPAP